MKKEGCHLSSINITLKWWLGGGGGGGGRAVKWTKEILYRGESTT